MDFVLKLMDFALTIMDLVLKMMDFALKMMDFVLKMMDFALKVMDLNGNGQVDSAFYGAAIEMGWAEIPDHNSFEVRAFVDLPPTCA